MPSTQNAQFTAMRFPMERSPDGDVQNAQPGNTTLAHKDPIRRPRVAFKSASSLCKENALEQCRLWGGFLVPTAPYSSPVPRGPGVEARPLQRPNRPPAVQRVAAQRVRLLHVDLRSHSRRRCAWGKVEQHALGYKVSSCSYLVAAQSPSTRR